jgi:hypothetical protein
MNITTCGVTYMKLNTRSGTAENISHPMQEYQHNLCLKSAYLTAYFIFKGICIQSGTYIISIQREQQKLSILRWQQPVDGDEFVAPR